MFTVNLTVSDCLTATLSANGVISDSIFKKYTDADLQTTFDIAQISSTVSSCSLDYSLTVLHQNGDPLDSSLFLFDQLTNTLTILE